MVKQRGLTRAVALVFLVAAWGIPKTGAAQQDFIRGRNVQPAFEGWEKNADGSFNLVFGYLNRNAEEEPNVPIGPNNFFEPGPQDRGQPTHFYPRRQMFVFKVQVPADWGNKELVWTVTHNGRTDKAVGHLVGVYALDTAVYRAQRSGASARASTADELRDKGPSVALDGPAMVSTTVGAPVPLAVTVHDDDGLPGPAATRPETGERPNAKVNAVYQDKVTFASARKTGLAATFLHYRGPGQVTFEPMVVELPQRGGRASTTARFDEPGTYVVQAVADDQILKAHTDITVNVGPAGGR